MWVLAVRDFHTRTGGDLLAALQAGQFDQVSKGLQATWTGGANAGFAARHRVALPLVAPAPPPPPEPTARTITLRLGMQESFPLAGVDQDGHPFTPPDALISDDPKVCLASVVSAPDQATGTAAIAAVNPGTTRVHGADLAIDVTVEAPRLVHLTADFSKAVADRRATGGQRSRNRPSDAARSSRHDYDLLSPARHLLPNHAAKSLIANADPPWVCSPPTPH